MQAHSNTVDIDKIVDAGPLHVGAAVKKLFWLFVVIGVVTFLVGLAYVPAQEVWGVYYVNLIFWMGLSIGAAVTPAIFQIVRAKWSASIRRVGEAHSAFLPWAFLLFLATYFGKEVLFPWARAPMPGREWWMQPNFVYLRFFLLFGLLFLLICRFVRLSLREDIGLAREIRPNDKRWQGWPFYALVKNWRGTEQEVQATQEKLSWNAPLIIALYAVIYSLFAFEMIMGMDTIWFSNMFGGFMFVGNIYLGWGATIVFVLFLCGASPAFNSVARRDQLWDLGKLLFGFCMLWGYLFWAQFLVQWYGNLPEETQWLILRTREYPWKGLSWIVFSMCFIIPFMVLISEDVKRTPKAILTIVSVIMVGVWLQNYVLVMPQLIPETIPLNAAKYGAGIIELGITLGFFGAYALAVLSFLGRYPLVPIAHPLTRGVNKW